MIYLGDHDPGLYSSMREGPEPASGFPETCRENARSPFADEESFGSGIGAEAELAAKPGASVDPVAIGGAGGDTQDRGGLVARQAGEVAQFDEFGLERVVFCQPAQRSIKGQQVEVRLGRDEGLGIDLLALPATAVLVALF